MNVQKPFLSIIVPCYNCETTVEEAVDSIFSQTMLIPYQVIAIDDGSTDQTGTVLERLQQVYPLLQVIRHSVNKGGGAARNTGIGSSKGNLIYCMDSDNILDENSLQKMVQYLQKKQADGVAFEKRKYFVSGKNHISTTVQNTVLKRSLHFSDLFEKSPPHIDNFLFTKKSYLEAGKYPEHHGFDTQGYEVAFLGTGHSLWICPKTIFFHRQFDTKKSYFEREYEKGEFSLNTYLTLEPVLHLFSDTVVEQICTYDVFSKNILWDENIQSFLQRKLEEKASSFFRNDYEKFMKPDGFSIYLKHVGIREKNSQYLLAIHYILDRKYLKALGYFERIMATGTQGPLLFWNCTRACVALGVHHEGENIISLTHAMTSACIPVRRPEGVRKGLLTIGFEKIQRILKRVKI